MYMPDVNLAISRATGMLIWARNRCPPRASSAPKVATPKMSAITRAMKAPRPPRLTKAGGPASLEMFGIMPQVVTWSDFRSATRIVPQDGLQGLQDGGGDKHEAEDPAAKDE